jgi:hypothetical protein
VLIDSSPTRRAGSLGRLRGNNGDWTPSLGALPIHLAAAPFIAFVVSAIHKWIAPEFDPVLRAAAMIWTIIVLDAVVVVPPFERSYAMFRSLIEWLPSAAISLASWVGGILVPL